jgi:hypothetical protein
MYLTQGKFGVSCVDAHASTLGVQVPWKDFSVEKKRVGIMICDVTTVQVCSELVECQYLDHGDSMTADFVFHLSYMLYDIKTRINAREICCLTTT